MTSILPCPCFQVEAIGLDEESLARLGEIGEAASLRHAVQLLTPAHVLAKVAGRTDIALTDVEDTAGLFLDAKQSARLLAEHADKYVH